MKTKVSIIIPVHNTERFLTRCLDSCINQTLEDIEIIVVNDASPDRSDIIMQKYEQMYPEKIRCIYLKKNLKQGGARNLAIRLARGEFLAFVDSDDWIEAQMCEKLYEKAKRDRADIVYCNVLRERKEGGYLVSNRFPNEAVGNVSENVLEILTQPYVAPWAHIIRKNIITDHDLYFPEHLVAEDTAITKLWDLYAKRIDKIEGAYYVYCLNVNSTGQSKMLSYRKDEYECIKILYDHLNKCKKVEPYEMERSLICMRYALNFAFAMLKRNGKEFIEEITEGFQECIHYVCRDVKENILWKYWFTPKECLCLLGESELDCYGDSASIKEDYRQYYQKLKNEIEELLNDFQIAENKKIGIWGKTDYASGLNRVFSEMKIVDNVLDIDQYGIEYVLCLRILHIENIKKQLMGRNIRILNLQSYFLSKRSASEKHD